MHRTQNTNKTRPPLHLPNSKTINEKENSLKSLSIEAKKGSRYLALLDKET